MSTPAGLRTGVLVDLFGKLLALGACVASGRDVKEFGNPEHSWSRIQTMFAAAEHQSKSKAVEAAVFDDAKFAVAAFLDEMIRNTSWGQRGQWGGEKLLQNKFFGTKLAGMEFFERLERIRHTSPRNLDLLEVYTVCLTLGFSGRYGLSDQEELTRLIEKVTEEMQPGRGEQSILSPHGQRPQEFIDAVKRGLPVWAVCVIGAASTLLVYSVLEYFIEGQVTDLLNQLSLIRPEPEQ